MADFQPFVLSAEMLGHEGPVSQKRPMVRRIWGRERLIRCIMNAMMFCFLVERCSRLESSPDVSVVNSA